MLRFSASILTCCFLSPHPTTHPYPLFIPGLGLLLFPCRALNAFDGVAGSGIFLPPFFLTAIFTTFYCQCQTDSLFFVFIVFAHGLEHLLNLHLFTVPMTQTTEPVFPTIFNLRRLVQLAYLKQVLFMFYSKQAQHTSQPWIYGKILIITYAPHQPGPISKLSPNFD